MTKEKVPKMGHNIGDALENISTLSEKITSDDLV